MSSVVTYTSPSGVVFGVFEIPTQPFNQEFDTSLNGVTYHLRLKWNAPNQSWVLDIQDVQRNPILSGIPLITGADLLAQFKYAGIGGSLIVQSDFDTDEVPTYTSLGSTGHLYFASPQ